MPSSLRLLGAAELDAETKISQATSDASPLDASPLATSALDASPLATSALAHSLAESLADKSIERAMTTGLQRLQGACTERRNADHKLESTSCQLAWALARMVIDAQLVGVLLPRNYIARAKCGETYLEKCADSEDEILFVLARRDSTFARMEPRARELSNAQILEFMRDIENGLIEEIAAFVESCNLIDQRAARCLRHALTACEKATNEYSFENRKSAIFRGEKASLQDMPFPIPARPLPSRTRRKSRAATDANQLPFDG